MRAILQTLKLGLLLSASVVLATTTVTAQQVYKWKDDKGTLHYTQTPPPARYAQSLNIKERPAPVSASNGKNAVPVENSTSNPDNKTTPASKPAPVARLSAESCKAMQDNLALLQTGRRLYEKDAGGERAYMTEERRAVQIQTLQQNLANGCR